MAVILLLVATALLPARPTSAHICALPAHFPLGEDVNINITVPAEDKPVRAVDISVPAGFALTHAEGYLGVAHMRRRLNLLTATSGATASRQG